MLKNKFIINFLLYFFISIVIFSASSFYIKYEEQKQLHIKYINISDNIKQNLNSLIIEKKNATLALAMSLAKNKRIEDALLNDNNSELDFKNFSKYLKTYTKFKNVWFHVIDKDGKSFYRSWINKTDDDVNFREDVRKIKKDKQILATISVGKFDMTFKSMIPIFSKGNFIGIFEVITHFNSIAKTLEKENIESVILADKEYRKKIVKPFTNKFLGEYYIANLDVKQPYINLIKQIGLDTILDNKSYLLKNNNLLTTFNITTVDNKHIGYYILIQNINKIDISEIQRFKKNSKIYVIIFIFLIGLLYTIISYYIYAKSINTLNKELQKNIDSIKTHEKKNQIILDSQKNLIVITDGYYLKNSNKQLLEFYEFDSLEDFRNKYDCICETFIDMNDDNYLLDKDYEGKNWAEHILDNPETKFKAAIKKCDTIHHFTLDVNLSLFEDEETPYIIVTLTDITQEIKVQKELIKLNGNLEDLVDVKTKELQKLNESLENRVKEEISKSKEKDRILFQQNKMASMGEMLSNIAHQWRQPLASISAAVSSLKIQKQLNLINDEDFDSLCEHIIKNSQYLSKTIENFKNFFRQDEEKVEFLLLNSIEESILLLKDKLNDKQIKIHIQIDENKKLFGYKNEFQQAIVNILNNSLDAFTHINNSDIKVISIVLENSVLKIYDNAKGIDSKIIDKVFEPYFTTKHQSQGTGLGLFMTREILVKSMNFGVDIENKYFEYDNKKLYGTCVKINLNKQ